MTLTTTQKKNGQLPSLFEDFFSDRFFDMPSFLNHWNSASLPNTNIIEDSSKFIIELAAPGLERGDFNVEIKNGVLSISAEKEEETKEDSKNFRKREFSYNSFVRSFSLPENLAADKIDAKYRNGVLQLTLPKKEVKPSSPAKQITVG